MSTPGGENQSAPPPPAKPVTLLCWGTRALLAAVTSTEAGSDFAWIVPLIGYW